MKIGIFGESPYESKAIASLLSKQHNKTGARFAPMLKNLPGGQLLSAKAVRLFSAEMELHGDFHGVIVMHDLDAPPTNTAKRKEIIEWYNQFKQIAYCQSILLLNIEELEALLLADIETVNAAYKCKLKFTANPEYQSKPKEYLKERTYSANKRSSYKESDVEKLFDKVNYDNLLKVPYFKAFHDELEELLKPAKDN